jgi:hypothetical protein
MFKEWNFENEGAKLALFGQFFIFFPLPVAESRNDFIKQKPRQY